MSDVEEYRAKGFVRSLRLYSAACWFLTSLQKQTIQKRKDIKYGFHLLSLMHHEYGDSY